MEYYPAIKKNEITPFATAQMDLQSIILSEVSQRKTHVVWYHSFVESNFLNDTKELFSKIETDSQNGYEGEGWGIGYLGSLWSAGHTAVFKMDS